VAGHAVIAAEERLRRRAPERQKTMKKLGDLVCLSLWVFSYRAIVVLFLLIRRFERVRHG
jgi:hypothetical protein